ncbi:MAG TPA: HlyD family secretion protein [Caulobacteraceae bacterium]|nr:HlyD family secretion protein [Caulobacteraceae bacterium]
MTTAERTTPAIRDVSRKDDVPRDATRITPKVMAIRIAVAAAVVAVLCTAGAGGAYYWTTGRFVQSTDDAYVKADSSAIAPKVSGYIARLLVNDNETVKAGQPLAVIDDRDLRQALDEAKANVSAAAAAVANLNAQITAQGSVIQQADASVAAQRASLGLARRDDSRRQKMAEVGYGTVEQADTASTNVQETSANLSRLVAAAADAREQTRVLTAQRDLAQAQLAHAQAALGQAQLNLSYATITAPIDGTVGARTVRVGQYVQAGTQLMALVPLQKVYVVANYKETQLTRVARGQPARIKVDAFPGDDIVGRVDSIAPASGLEFALLPPDNATGNFTKIVQRIPVKIVFDGKDALSGRLRPGMSVNASIDTKGGRA